MAQGDITLTVTGTLTADPDLRFTPAGHAVANFTVATNPRIFDRDAQEWKDGEATFLRCNVWRDQAEHVAESLTKGARVTVTGVLRQRNYEHEGQKRVSYEITADEVSASLRWATAKITKATRGGGGAAVDDPSAGDPWSTPVGAGAQGGGPPF